MTKYNKKRHQRVHCKNKFEDFQMDVKFEKNRVTFYKLNHHMVISKFLRGLLKSISNGNSKYYVDFSQVDAQVFPNVAVPLSAIFAYFSSQGIQFKFVNTPKFIGVMNLSAPKQYDGGVILNKVWEFTAEDVGGLVDAYISELSIMDTYPKGFLAATEWSLNEVMDNVIQHSKVNSGFVMGQVHPTTKHVAFTIFDMGQGILNSFKGSNHRPQTAVDAITLALQESVTRDKAIGQGNGLFGLSTLMKQGDSRLKITSGRGYYSYKYGESVTYNDCPIISEDVSMTTIDFMLDYSNDVSIENALIFNGKIYTPISLRIENMEDVDGNIRILIKEESNGTGTRQAAMRIKHKILNILSEEPKNIILDFSGVSMISSSYADELLAKLFCALGLFQFNRIIKILGLSEEQQLILQKSVVQRIIEDYKDISS